MLRLAQDIDHVDADDTIFLYFHTKGMVHHGQHLTRYDVEANLSRGTIEPWQQIAAVFQANATVTRVGIFPSGMGWLWHNFWWARASYLQTLVEPIRSITYRHYYETWLARQFINPTDHEAESEHWMGCDTCYAFNGNCSGYGFVYSPDDLVFCDNASA